MNRNKTIPQIIKNRRQADQVFELSTGYFARFTPVATSLLEEASLMVKDPDIPMWMHPDKGREEPNPNDPVYLQQLAENNHKRGIMVMDAMIMFGAELVEEDGVTLLDIASIPGLSRKLKMLEKIGIVKLGDYDLEDSVDLEFLFKKYIAISVEDTKTLASMSGISQEAIAAASATFQPDQVREADSGTPDPRPD